MILGRLAQEKKGFNSISGYFMDVLPFNYVMFDGKLAEEYHNLNLILDMNCILVAIMHSLLSQDKQSVERWFGANSIDIF